VPSRLSDKVALITGGARGIGRADGDRHRPAAVAAAPLSGHEDGTAEEARLRLSESHAIPIAMVQALDVANAVLFLASEEARYITGVSLPVDLGALVK
jgi:NAD(P)-dependent dehydrogenase (short-subunit alcohol dehydrogenase family)